MIWTLTVILVSAALSAYLIVRELKQTTRRGKSLRIITSLLAVFSLALIAFNFYFSGNNISSPGHLLLITEGANPDSVNAFKKKNPDVSAGSFEPLLADEFGARLIDLLTPANRYERVDIFGYGAEASQLAALNSAKLYLHSDAEDLSLTAVSWNRQIRSGDPLLVQGRYVNDGDDSVTIRLSGFGNTLDSTIIAPGVRTAFQLETVPKQIGRTVFEFRISSGSDDETIVEKLAFETISDSPQKILVLSSTPNFENRFLKQWLFTRAYGIASRTTISLDKYNQEFLNIGETNLRRINAPLLSQFDLLISDASTLATLSRDELSVLNRAVQNEGLGLLVKVDSLLPGRRFFNEDFSFTLAGRRQMLQLTAADSSVKWPTLETTSSRSIKLSDKLKALTVDQNGRVYAASALHGKGRILQSAAMDTYRWTLSGDSLLYQQYWTLLLNESLKPAYNGDDYTKTPAIALVNKPASIRIEEDSDQPFEIMAGQNIVGVQQDPLLQSRWEGIYWPETTGWQLISKTNTRPRNFYVFGQDDWSSIKKTERVRMNRLAADKSMEIVTRTESMTDQQNAGLASKEEIPKAYFLIIFLISCAYLWITEKLSPGGT